MDLSEQAKRHAEAERICKELEEAENHWHEHEVAAFDLKNEVKRLRASLKEIRLALGLPTRKRKPKAEPETPNLPPATPALTGQEAADFLAKVHEQANQPVGPTPTPKLAEAEKAVRKFARSRKKQASTSKGGTSSSTTGKSTGQSTYENQEPSTESTRVPNLSRTREQIAAETKCPRCGKLLKSADPDEKCQCGNDIPDETVNRYCGKE